MYSRRQFLICAGVALLPTGLQGLAKLHPAADTGMGFHAVELDTLAAIMDEIIPAGEGMPAASVAGGPQYLQYLGWQYPAIQREIGDFLRTVTQTSSDIFRQDFRKLSSGQHVRVHEECATFLSCRRFEVLLGVISRFSSRNFFVVIPRAACSRRCGPTPFGRREVGRGGRVVSSMSDFPLSILVPQLGKAQTHVMTCATDAS
jgi:hypothetical protein